MENLEKTMQIYFPHYLKVIYDIDIRILFDISLTDVSIDGEIQKSSPNELTIILHTLQEIFDFREHFILTKTTTILVIS